MSSLVRGDKDEGDGRARHRLLIRTLRRGLIILMKDSAPASSTGPGWGGGGVEQVQNCPHIWDKGGIYGVWGSLGGSPSCLKPFLPRIPEECPSPAAP